MAQPLVLVVDDEPDLVELVSLTLARMQFETQSASDVAGAKKLLKAQRFDLCLTDMRLPDGDGLDLLEWMSVQCPGVPCAVITAHGNVESAVRALKLGAFDFVSKPLDIGVLRRIVSTAVRLSPRAAAGTQRHDALLIGSGGPLHCELRSAKQEWRVVQVPLAFEHLLDLARFVGMVIPGELLMPAIDGQASAEEGDAPECEKERAAHEVRRMTRSAVRKRRSSGMQRASATMPQTAPK